MAEAGLELLILLPQLLFGVMGPPCLAQSECLYWNSINVGKEDQASLISSLDTLPLQYIQISQTSKNPIFMWIRIEVNYKTIEVLVKLQCL